jgi:hypothetical protein
VVVTVAVLVLVLGGATHAARAAWTARAPLWLVLVIVLFVSFVSHVETPVLVVTSLVVLFAAAHTLVGVLAAFMPFLAFWWSFVMSQISTFVRLSKCNTNDIS